MCPHCQAAVDDAALYCQQCGKAVRVEPGFPRFVEANTQFATSATGQTLQADQLWKRARAAFGALLAVAIMLTLGTAIMAAIAAWGPPPGRDALIDTDDAKATALVLGVLASLFYACAVWARKQPLPAAISGLTLYMTLNIIGAVANPLSLLEGWPIKIIVTLILIKAVSAGIMHRRVAARMEAGDQARSGA